MNIVDNRESNKGMDRVYAWINQHEALQTSSKDLRTAGPEEGLDKRKVNMSVKERKSIKCLWGKTVHSKP